MNTSILHNELIFKAVRSSGAGGQHVNKVSSKVELNFDLASSKGISEKEKIILYTKLHNKLSKKNILILTCQESRSQHRNKEIVISRFFELITKSLIQQKKRKATKPSRLSIYKRLESKKNQSLKKSLRKKPKID